MTGKLMFVPDGWVVVPREPDDRMLTVVACCSNDNVPTSGSGNSLRKNIFKNEYSHAIAAAPQLTTSPVLRWEGCELFVGNRSLADISINHDKTKWHFYISNRIETGEFLSESEARRAAEKALGLPIVEEVK